MTLAVLVPSSTSVNPVLRPPPVTVNPNGVDVFGCASLMIVMLGFRVTGVGSWS